MLGRVRASRALPPGDGAAGTQHERASPLRCRGCLVPLSNLRLHLEFSPACPRLPVCSVSPAPPRILVLYPRTRVPAATHLHEGAGLARGPWLLTQPVPGHRDLGPLLLSPPPGSCNLRRPWVSGGTLQEAPMSGHGAAGGLCLAWGEHGGGPRPRVWARQKGGPLRVRGTLAGRSGDFGCSFGLCRLLDPCVFHVAAARPARGSAAPSPCPCGLASRLGLRRPEWRPSNLTT